MTDPLVCMEANKDCWGEVASYSFDLDLPVVNLCKGHVWSITKPRTPYEKIRIADEIADDGS